MSVPFSLRQMIDVHLCYDLVVLTLSQSSFPLYYTMIYIYLHTRFFLPSWKDITSSSFCLFRFLLNHSKGWAYTKSEFHLTCHPHFVYPSHWPLKCRVSCQQCAWTGRGRVEYRQTTASLSQHIRQPLLWEIDTACQWKEANTLGGWQLTSRVWSKNRILTPAPPSPSSLLSSCW